MKRSNTGVLVVEGSIANSATTVKGGAGLAGIGALGDVTIESGGGHSPGRIGETQTVEGDYTLAGGAVLIIQVNAAGQNSGLVVKGTLDVTNAILNIIASPGSYAYATPYLLIDNQGSNAVMGQFQALLLLNFAFLDATLDYAARDGNDVELTLLRNDVSFADVANTPNQVCAKRAGILHSIGSSHPEPQLDNFLAAARQGV